MAVARNDVSKTKRVIMWSTPSGATQCGMS